MRHWQPIHHARWRDFLAGIAAALRGEAPTPAPAPAPAPQVAAPRFAAPVVPAIIPAIAPAVREAIAPVTPPAAIEEPVFIAPAPAFEPIAEPVTEPIVEATPEPIVEPLVEPVLETPVAVIPEPEPVAFAPAAPEPEPAPVPEPIPEPAPVFVAPPAPTPPLAPAPVFELASPAEPVAPVEGSTARAFFSALGWTGGPRRVAPVAPRSAPARVIERSEAPVLAPAPEPVPSASTSAAYFRSLPWTGAQALGDVIRSIRVTAARDDSALDPRTANLPPNNPLLTGMLSAARTSDRLAARPAAPTRARAYFNALPWARA